MPAGQETQQRNTAVLVWDAQSPYQNFHSLTFELLPNLLMLKYSI